MPFRDVSYPPEKSQDGMRRWIVLYHESNSLPFDPPLAYACSADDSEHAEEQCAGECAGREIVWVYLGESADEAYREYWQL